MSIQGICVSPICHRSEALSLHSCGIGKFEKNFCHGPNVREEYVIHYVTEGCGWLETPRGKFRFGEGDIFCIHPGEIIKYYVGDTVCRFAFVNFVGSDAEKTYSAIGITRETPVIHVGIQPIVGGVEQCMYYIKSTHNPSQLRLTGFLLETLSYMEAGKGQPSAKLKDVCTAQGIAYMEYAFDRDLSMDEVASAAGVERSYFYRVFKEKMGISPIAYLTRLRIKKAKTLITAGMSFKEAASAVGISDVYYFSKLFTKTEGITPSEYRKQNADTENRP